MQPPELTAEQQAVVEKILHWFRHTSRQTLTMGGYAGTGKTTLIRHLKDVGLGKLVVLAPTGKAAQVLRRKGIAAQTIHSWLYEPPQEQPDGSLTWTVGDPTAPNLVIVDESSMVSRDIHEDLLATENRILWVGDHGQLEPVGDNPNLMRNPELRLEKIMRQAADSPILSLAHRVREGAPLAMTASDELTVNAPGDIARDAARMARFDIILTAFNRTRVSVNNAMRRHLGFVDQLGQVLPLVNERLICLRNNRRKGIYNGQLGTVVRLGRVAGDVVTIDWKPDGESLRENLVVYLPQLGEEKTVSYSALPPDTQLFDFGYCITVHKSQGSEWDSVLVIEPSTSAVKDMWDVNRWRYTAVTRAAKRLTYLAPSAMTPSQARKVSQPSLFEQGASHAA